MLLPLALVTVASLLLLLYKFRQREGNSESKRRKGNFWMILKGVFNFLFRVKSEDRLNSFKAIHKLFPRYTRLTLFGSDNLVIYDPELCKKVYMVQTACQRPFRNCFQLEYGLLSSECTQNKFQFHGQPFVSLLLNFRWHNNFVNHVSDLVSDHYWKKSRKHLNLAFHLNVLKGFIPIFYDYADGVCQEMEKNNLDGKEFDLLFPLAKLTARSVAGW